MKQSNVIVLWGVSTIYICLALVMPLHACEQSGSSGGKAAVSASDTMGKHAMTAKTKKMESPNKQAVAHKTDKVVKHPVDTSAVTGNKEKKKAEQKEKPQVKVVNVDFKVLKERLKKTDAIGFFTKLAIRNDIVDLMDKIKQYRNKSMLKAKMKEIRASFDGLLLKIVALLEEDPNLSRDLYVGRESIWESLLEVKV